MANTFDGGVRTFVDPIPGRVTGNEGTPGSDRMPDGNVPGRTDAAAGAQPGGRTPEVNIGPDGSRAVPTQDTRRLAELIKDARVAMFTTFPGQDASAAPHPQAGAGAHSATLSGGLFPATMPVSGVEAKPGVAPPAHAEGTAGIAAAATSGYAAPGGYSGSFSGHARAELHPRAHVRPMYTQPLDPDKFDGELFFMTDKGSQKVEEIRHDQPVLITYSDSGKNRYIAVYGTASCERNPAKARELWNIHAKGLWPGGPEDPNLMLIRVRVQSAEYWDGPSNASYMISLLKSLATHERIDIKSEHATVRVP